MYKKIIAATSLATTLSLSAALPAFANATPNFGTCLNPQWSQSQVNYGSNHGVVGIGSFAGTDTIYSSNGNVLQCLCTDTGEGYQTNWMKASGLSTSEIDSFKAQGWIYVPYGNDWGLEKGPYLAQNSTYACTSCTPTPTPENSPTPTPSSVTPTETPAPGPTATPTPETKIEAASANNTLASTGNSFLIYISLLAGAASLALGMIIRKLVK